MKINKEIKSGVVFTIIGLFIGWLIFGGSNESRVNTALDNHEHEIDTKYTCSMHPQIRQNEPGSCPICGMDLIPLENEMEEDDNTDYTVKLTNSAMKIADVSTARVSKKTPYKTLRLTGKVMADERRNSELTARYPGRIEQLLVNYTGQIVRKGQVLAKIYSPELITAQKELFEASKFKETNSSYYKAVRNKLKLWGITASQIESIEKSGEVQNNINILSPLSGTVTMRHISLGDYVKEGSTLFKIQDLSKVWVIFDAYESDLSWIKMNDKISFTIPSLPGDLFESTVSFIDPIVNAKSRVVGIRAEVPNKNGLLKPQMLASGKLKAMLSSNQEVLMVPKSGILWTGKTSVVYVKTSDQKNLFQYREITLGADAGDDYVVLDGLKEGEMIASNGVFKIDAAAQLKGEQSMMNPMSTKPIEKNSTKISNQEISTEFKNQIRVVLNMYLDLKDQLVNSDQEASSKSAENVEKSLNAVNMKLIEGMAHLKWMKLSNSLNKEIGRIKTSTNIENQRTAFIPLSQSLYEALIYFKVEGTNAYYQFCPMANDNNGASWLSSTEEIRNPYFGDAMMSCGETKEILK